MNSVTVAVDALIALWLLAVLVAVVRAVIYRTPRLTSLSARAHERFSRSWAELMADFVSDPHEAVGQADALVVSLLRARHHPLDGKRQPRSLRDARSWVAREKREGTEALRQAMLQYKAAFTQVIGRRPVEEGVQLGRRREMA